MGVNGGRGTPPRRPAPPRPTPQPAAVHTLYRVPAPTHTPNTAAGRCALRRTLSAQPLEAGQGRLHRQQGTAPRQETAPGSCGGGFQTGFRWIAGAKSMLSSCMPENIQNQGLERNSQTKWHTNHSTVVGKSSHQSLFHTRFPSNFGQPSTENSAVETPNHPGGRLRWPGLIAADIHTCILPFGTPQRHTARVRLFRGGKAAQRGAQTQLTCPLRHTVKNLQQKGRKRHRSG